jgi:hypothetical protein
MGYFRSRSALVMGAIALLIGIGAGVIFASQQASKAFAEDGETEIEGVIEALPATGAVGTWRVSGRNVIVTEGTEIDRDGQTLAPGVRVEIEGYVQPDGSIVAEEIEVQDANDNTGPTANSDDDDDGGPAASTAPVAPLLPSAHGDDDDDGPSTASRTHADDDDD